MHADVAIVGAGPAGLAAAIRLGQLGAHHFVIVDRQTFPRDKTCGGAITPAGIRVLKSLGVYTAIAAHSHPVGNLRFKFHGNREINLRSEVLVCPRRVLDQVLLKRAVELGGIFVPNFQVNYLLLRGDRVCGIHAADGREIHARQTVVANGSRSHFVPERGRHGTIRTIMGWWETDRSKCDHLEFVFDRTLKPYYGWRFPEGPTRINIGICYEDGNDRKNARNLLSSFLKRHYSDVLMSGRQVGNYKGQPISSSFRAVALTSPGRIVVGEAGGMVDPASGEGIYHALCSGVLAGQALCQILTHGVVSSHAFERYETACRKTFDQSFRLGRLIRHFIGHGGFDVLPKIAPSYLLGGLCNGFNNFHPSLRARSGLAEENTSGTQMLASRNSP
jgi:menaquinone-9 beta-reductase